LFVRCDGRIALHVGFGRFIDIDEGINVRVVGRRDGNGGSRTIPSRNTDTGGIGAGTGRLTSTSTSTGAGALFGPLRLGSDRCFALLPYWHGSNVNW